MVDIHSHILPGIDDGAPNVLESLKLLQLQKENDINKIILTPHFNIENCSLQHFLKIRDASMQQLNSALTEKNINSFQFKLGAETYLSPKLLDIDLQKLCIANTNYLLVEFPYNYYMPWTKNVLYEISMLGITPVIAHVERYPYFQEDATNLCDIVNSGALAQVNASSIVRHASLKKLVLAFIKHKLVYAVATDTHSALKRPPMLAQAFKLIEGKLGTEVATALKHNADKIFTGEDINTYIPSTPKKIFGMLF